MRVGTVVVSRGILPVKMMSVQEFYTTGADCYDRGCGRRRERGMMIHRLPLEAVHGVRSEELQQFRSGNAGRSVWVLISQANWTTEKRRAGGTGGSKHPQRAMRVAHDEALMFGGGNAGMLRFGQRRIQAQPGRALANGRHGGSGTEGGGGWIGLFSTSVQDRWRGRKATTMLALEWSIHTFQAGKPLIRCRLVPADWSQRSPRKRSSIYTHPPRFV